MHVYYIIVVTDYGWFWFARLVRQHHKTMCVFITLFFFLFFIPKTKLLITGMISLKIESQ